MVMLVLMPNSPEEETKGERLRRVTTLMNRDE